MYTLHAKLTALQENGFGVIEERLPFQANQLNTKEVEILFQDSTYWICSLDTSIANYSWWRYLISSRKIYFTHPVTVFAKITTGKGRTKIEIYDLSKKERISEIESTFSNNEVKVSMDPKTIILATIEDVENYISSSFELQ